MAKRPSYSRVSKLLRYDPGGGKMIWLVRQPRTKPGTRAGSISGKETSKHLIVTIDQRSYYVHHIAWLLMTERWPKTLIGFGDGDGTNCRWRNLMPTNERRLHTHSRIYRNNTSGFRGVCFHRRKRKWYACIYVNKRYIFLGYHDKRSEAATARRRAAVRYGYRA